MTSASKNVDVTNMGGEIMDFSQQIRTYLNKFLVKKKEPINLGLYSKEVDSPKASDMSRSISPPQRAKIIP